MFNAAKMCVQVLDAGSGETVRVIGAGIAGSGVGQLSSPRGLVFRRARPGSARPNLLYVAEEKNNRIQVSIFLFRWLEY